MNDVRPILEYAASQRLSIEPHQSSILVTFPPGPIHRVAIRLAFAILIGISAGWLFVDAIVLGYPLLIIALCGALALLFLTDIFQKLNVLRNLHAGSGWRTLHLTSAALLGSLPPGGLATAIVEVRIAEHSPWPLLWRTYRLELGTESGEVIELLRSRRREGLQHYADELRAALRI